MAIKFEKIQPGMELLDIHSHRVGNTTMRRLGLWKVRVISVDRVRREAVVSWNGNSPERWDHRRLSRLHVSPTRAYLRQQSPNLSLARKIT